LKSISADNIGRSIHLKLGQQEFLGCWSKKHRLLQLSIVLLNKLIDVAVTVSVKLWSTFPSFGSTTQSFRKCWISFQIFVFVWNVSSIVILCYLWTRQKLK